MQIIFLQDIAAQFVASDGAANVERTFDAARRESGENIQQRGFASPRGTHDGRELASVEFARNAIQHSFLIFLAHRNGVVDVVERDIHGW